MPWSLWLFDLSLWGGRGWDNRMFLGHQEPRAHLPFGGQRGDPRRKSGGFGRCEGGREDADGGRMPGGWQGTGCPGSLGSLLLGDLQKPPRCPALGVPACAELLVQVTPRGPCRPQLSCGWKGFPLLQVAQSWSNALRSLCTRNKLPHVEKGDGYGHISSELGLLGPVHV